MNFTLRCVRFYPGVNSRAVLVSPAPGLRPQRRFGPLAGKIHENCRSIGFRNSSDFFFLLTYNHLHDIGADIRTDKIPNKVLLHIILTNNFYRTSFTLQNKILNTYIYEQQSLIDERHLQQIVLTSVVENGIVCKNISVLRLPNLMKLLFTCRPSLVEDLKVLRLLEGITNNMDSSKLIPKLLQDLREKSDEVSFKMKIFNIQVYYVTYTKCVRILCFMY